MLTVRGASGLKIMKRCICLAQNALKNVTPDESAEKSNLGDIASKYQPFRDEDSSIIRDAYEEKLQYSELLLEEEELQHDQFEGINLERGKSGVYEMAELIAVLERDNAENIFVASVPADIKYVDYMCVVTGKSQRHMQAIAQFVRRVYKKKRHSYDVIPKIEGEESKDWIALDLGNIALHIFSREARIKYDLDSLWALGPQYDEEYNKQDPIVEMLEKHSIYLKDLVPAT